MAGRREARIGVEPEALEDRQHEGGRLARARLGGGKDIAALEDERDGLDLDRVGSV